MVIDAAKCSNRLKNHNEENNREESDFNNSDPLVLVVRGLMELENMEMANCKISLPLFFKWKQLSIFLILSVMVMASSSAEVAARESAAPCEEFRKLLGTPIGLHLYMLSGAKDDRPGHDEEQLILNVDLDGDDISDEISLFCPNTGSSMPADPCSMSAKLSSSKKVINFEKLRFFLIRYRAKVYIVSSIDIRRQEDADKTDIYRLDQSGPKLVCSKL